MFNSFPIENREKYIDYPDSYKELNEEQRVELDKFIQQKEIKPSIGCVGLKYSPSSYYSDELNAYNETLKAINYAIFNMSNAKKNEYAEWIKFYEIEKKKAEDFENKKNYNVQGYEKN